MENWLNYRITKVSRKDKVYLEKKVEGEWEPVSSHDNIMQAEKAFKRLKFDAEIENLNVEE